jgi:hypothetical protein
MEERRQPYTPIAWQEQSFQHENTGREHRTLGKARATRAGFDFEQVDEAEEHRAWEAQQLAGNRMGDSTREGHIRVGNKMCSIDGAGNGEG